MCLWLEIHSSHTCLLEEAFCILLSPKIKTLDKLLTVHLSQLQARGRGQQERGDQCLCLHPHPTRPHLRPQWPVLARLFWHQLRFHTSTPQAQHCPRLETRPCRPATSAARAGQGSRTQRHQGQAGTARACQPISGCTFQDAAAASKACGRGIEGRQPRALCCRTCGDPASASAWSTD